MVASFAAFSKSHNSQLQAVDWMKQDGRTVLTVLESTTEGSHDDKNEDVASDIDVVGAVSTGSSRSTSSPVAVSPHAET